MNDESLRAPSGDLVQRLALPQYLFREGERSLSRPGPYSGGSATSLFQDAVEALLGILVEHRGVRIGGSDPFPALLNKTGEVYPGILDHRAPMNRLNKARAAFKHHGIRISKEDAASFCANARDFLSEICGEALGVDFWSVSLVDVVGHQRTQNWLCNAERSVRAGEYAAATECAAKAAAVFLRYRARASGGAEGDLHYVSIGGGPPTWPHRFDPMRGLGFEFETGAFFELIKAHLILMARGVDLAAFNRFQSLPPRVTLSTVGTFGGVRSGRTPVSPTEEDALFCVNFAIELAMRLQETSPPPRNASRKIRTSQTVLVEQPCEMIVTPNLTPSEVIRVASQGEKLLAYDGSSGSSEYVAVLQDYEQAYVPRKCVRMLDGEYGPMEDPESSPTPN